jgi:hypothetical protein
VERHVKWAFVVGLLVVLGALNRRFGAWLMLEQATGTLRSRWSARSAARTNDLDGGVAAATRLPVVMLVVIAGESAGASGRRGSGNRHIGVRVL